MEAPLLTLALLSLTNVLKDVEMAAPFRDPIDSDEAWFIQYKRIIKHPMDLGTVRHKLVTDAYDHVQQYIDDILLIWRIFSLSSL